MKLNHPISTRVYALMFVVIAAFPAMASAADGAVQDVRLWTAPDHTRLVFDLNQSVQYKLFRLHKPERIVLDLQNTRLKSRFNKLAIPDPVIKAIRHGTSRANVLRVVMDVQEKVQPRSFLLKPMQGKPYRLVIDLMRPQKDQAAAVTAEKLPRKGIVIAIDAGHGGEDPGAIGLRKLREKDVTLAVAKKLAKIINAKPGMTAVLIRKGDYFVPLRKRIYLARQAQADMMISIHTDAVRERSVKGASVYTLSERGATQDRAAKALAAKENAADEVGGVGAADEVYDSQVNLILSDMFRRDSLNSSQILAEEMLRKLKRAGPIKYGAPKRARFFVLGAMEIPSVLVELDYISNPARERQLKKGKHQQKLAAALFDASIRFFEKMGRLKLKQSQALRQQRSLSLFNANARQPSI